MRLQPSHRGITTGKSWRQVSGDRLSKSITRGFTAVGEADVAVCLPPGTELTFRTTSDTTARLASSAKRAWVTR